MTDPAFSAVIPARNAAGTLAAAIRSVLAQTADDLEVVVVDDGSTDDTLEQARSFEADPRVTVITQPNRGLAGARNTGIERSRGRYLGFLDSDDLWMPTFLEVLGGALEGDPGAGFAYTDGWALDERTGRIRRATTMARQSPPADPPRDAHAFLRLLVERNFVPAETLVRRAALEDVGAFNPALRAVEDYELWLRMLARGWRALRPPGILLIRRDAPTSMSKDQLRMLTALREVMRICLEEHPAPVEVKQIARRRMGWVEREISALEGRSRARQARRRARLALGRLKRRLAGERLWYETMPPEVAQAFPELDRDRHRPG